MKKSILLSCAIAMAAGAAAQQVQPARTVDDSFEPAVRTRQFKKNAEPLKIFATENNNLAAAFTCLNATTGTPTVVWSENFDNWDAGTFADGSNGWKVENAEYFSWELTKTTDDKAFSTIDPNDVQSLYIEGSFRIYERGYASVVSPSIAVPQNATFSGYIGFSYNLSEDYCTLTIFASDNDGETWSPIWSSLDDNSVRTWTWHKFDIDMTAYAGRSVKFKFEYGNSAAYDNGGYTGDFTIDGLQLSQAGEMGSVDVQTGEIVKFADASTGNPTSWQWSFPGGTPSTSEEQFPEVYYTRDGTYDVSLTVGDGENTASTTIEGFVNVTGTTPTAKIGLPATFRFDGNSDLAGTLRPMIAPLVPVQFHDASEGFPETREWSFTGVDPDPNTTTFSSEENPKVGYSYLHNQTVTLNVENSHGASDTSADVTVEYEGFISNLLPTDILTTFDLDGYGEFPGTNSFGITEYAEKFSKPSQPIAVSGVVVYFTQVEVAEDDLWGNIADIKVAICKSENGLPGEELDFSSWRVLDLDKPSSGTAMGNAFEFTRPVVIDDEFFIVVSGFPDKTDDCAVAFAMAQFRDNSNTAYFMKDGEWRSAAEYFPAGANHTSFAVSPYIIHSVMTPMSETPIKVGPAAGEATFEFYSYMGYETPVACDADWCRVVSEPNGMTLDEITIGYDALPTGVSSREATLTFTDGVGSVDVRIEQTPDGKVSILPESELKISPTLVVTTFTVDSESEGTIEVIGTTGNIVYAGTIENGSTTIDASGFAAGVYVVKTTTANGISTAKIMKR